MTQCSQVFAPCSECTGHCANTIIPKPTQPPYPLSIRIGLTAAYTILALSIMGLGLAAFTGLVRAERSFQQEARV